ncbi:hypothetical protein TL16_g10885 [Triparma laevis f. inornata]|uniref:SAM domain-containing protein n=1 Tax=Triparma laevis f. inornata TaxID=1714386 RepID=A0A9W7ERQ9_9STRA|nr:hypothetical protein TL16_g10885 [Triparma laevis f. inornata]
MPSSRRTSHAGLSSPPKRSGRERSSSVSVRGMASPDLIAGMNLGSPSKQQPRRVSIGGVKAPARGEANKEESKLKFKFEPRSGGVNAKAVRTTQEQIEMKAKMEAAVHKKDHLLHRRKSIEEESDASTSGDELDPKIADVVSRSSITHGPDSPQYVAARKLYDTNNFQPQPPSPSQPKKNLSGGPVSVRNLRYDTVENTKMKDIIHELEEREHQRHVTDEIDDRKAFKQVQVERNEDLVIHNGRIERESGEGSGGNSQQGSRQASPVIQARGLTGGGGVQDDQKPLLFVYVRTAKLGGGEEWLNASLELEIFPRTYVGKKMCKNITACADKNSTFHFHSFVKLDVHQTITTGETIVKKSKKDRAVKVPHLKVTAKGVGGSGGVLGVATMPMADVSLFGFKDYKAKGEGTDIPMSLMREDEEGGLFGKVFVRFMYVNVEDRDDKVCRKLAKRILNQANEERKACLKHGKTNSKKPIKQQTQEVKAVEPLEVPPQNLDQSAMSMGAPSSFPVQNMERDREFERQNLQHKSTMETLNATAQLLAQTVAMIGAKTANDVSQQRAKEEQEQQFQQFDRDRSAGPSPGGSRKGSNTGSSQHSPVNHDPLARKRSRRESLGDKPVLMWGVVDVATWLSSKQVGLAPYANMFVNQAVDGLAFVSMSEDQLDDYGIFNAAHKRKLLLHIARFRAQHKEELDAIDLEVENMGSKRNRYLDEGEESSDEEEEWQPPVSRKVSTNQEDRGSPKGTKARIKKQPTAGSSRKKSSDYARPMYNFANSPTNSGSKKKLSRDKTSSKGRKAEKESGSSSSLSDSDPAVRGRRSSQNAGQLIFDNPSRASRVVTEANEDRADTVLYTNMMKDVWKMV